MERPPLPNFVHPPLTEVALSMQFEELSNFRVIHLGALWEEFSKSAFPLNEEQPPVPKTFELLGVPQVSAGPQFELLNVPPMPRYLFLSSESSFIIQVQQDRFTVNWRRRSLDDVYPRFEAVLEKFDELAKKFQGFLSREKLGDIRVNQAEVTYVNRIETAELPGQVDRIVSVLSSRYSDGFLHDPDETNLSLRFPLYEADQLRGRLHIIARSGTSLGPGNPMNLMLLARGKPQGSDIKAAQEFFSIGRKHIVSAFASVTSKEMHLTWERTDND
jgi:uncharacterized protein (TIGR04255 family)